MNLPKEYEEDVAFLKKDFGLTDEEIEGFLEFFDVHIEKDEKANRRVVNIGPKENNKQEA